MNNESTSVSDKALAAKQQFRINPQSLTVLEGSDALLRCEITNLAGTVQWAKDGFALGKLEIINCFTNIYYNHLIESFIGFSEKIEGFPRYSQIGDRSHGIVNLRITNASLEDDAEYQCQVGPAQNSGPIRTGANLTVICKYYKLSIIILYTFLMRPPVDYTLSGNP